MITVIDPNEKRKFSPKQLSKKRCQLCGHGPFIFGMYFSLKCFVLDLSCKFNISVDLKETCPNSDKFVKGPNFMISLEMHH